MTPKQTALVNVTLLILTALLGGWIVALLAIVFTPMQLGIAFCVALLVYLIKMLYNMEVDRAETLQRLNDNR